MTDHIIFDNFLVTDDKEVHSSWVAQTWEKKSTAETYSSGGVRLYLSSLGLLAQLISLTSGPEVLKIKKNCKSTEHKI